MDAYNAVRDKWDSACDITWHKDKEDDKWFILLWTTNGERVSVVYDFVKKSEKEKKEYFLSWCELPKEVPEELQLTHKMYTGEECECFDGVLKATSNRFKYYSVVCGGNDICKWKKFKCNKSLSIDRREEEVDVEVDEGGAKGVVLRFHLQRDGVSVTKMAEMLCCYHNHIHEWKEVPQEALHHQNFHWVRIRHIVITNNPKKEQHQKFQQKKV